MKQLSPKRLRRRNNMLKKKIAGMSGSYHSINPLPPEVENQFLENIIAFEEQFQKKPKMQSVFAKIGKPVGFKPVVEIPDNSIEQEWNELYNYLLEHGIDLQICSPNVGPRELYRFATEELFKKKTNGFSIPGMMTCFIYDEFYPDHGYDNQVTAINCIEKFFNRSEFYEHHFAKQFMVNNHQKISFDEFNKLMKNFCRRSEKPKSFEVSSTSSVVDKKYGEVSGIYKISSGKVTFNVIPCKWTVEFNYIKKDKWWVITKIQIEGVDL